MSKTPMTARGAEKLREELKDLKKQRNQAKVKSVLETVKKTSENGENLVPSIVAAVKEYATIGEIVEVLKETYGEYTEKASYL